MKELRNISVMLVVGFVLVVIFMGISLNAIKVIEKIELPRYNYPPPYREVEYHYDIPEGAKILSITDYGRHTTIETDKGTIRVENKYKYTVKTKTFFKDK